MAQRKSEHTEIDEIILLIEPLSTTEQDHVVLALTQHFGKPDQRTAQDTHIGKVVREDRRDLVAQVGRQALQLAECLTADEEDQLLEELKLVWLRQAISEGEKSLAEDGGIPAEELFTELRRRSAERQRKSEP